MATVTIERHPRSGERFAIERAEDRTILRCAGPLPIDVTSNETAQDYLDNQDDGDARDDATWWANETGEATTPA